MNLRDCETTQDESRPGFVRRRARLGRGQIGCSVYELPPAQRNRPFHYHDGNEEWLVVVSGTPTLRTPAGERELRPGDVVAFSQGEAGAHDVANRSSEDVRVAIFSTLRQGSVVYVDSDKIAAGPPHDRRVFRRSATLDYWDGEA